MSVALAVEHGILRERWTRALDMGTIAPVRVAQQDMVATIGETNRTQTHEKGVGFLFHVYGNIRQKNWINSSQTKKVE